MSYHHYHICEEDNGGGYYSVSRFLTESEPVQFDTNEDTRIHDWRPVDPSFPGDDVPTDATITVPFWMCRKRSRIEASGFKARAWDSRGEHARVVETQRGTEVGERLRGLLGRVLRSRRATGSC